MKVVYIAGPYTGDPERHTHNAQDVATAARACGAAAIVPHVLSHGVEDTLTEAQWMQHCIAVLGRCDAVVVLPGYERSVGTLREMAAAEALAIPVYGARAVSWDPDAAFGEALRRWLSGS
jgi:nucleoside 2-deoxyribosyltransferase